MTHTPQREHGILVRILAFRLGVPGSNPSAALRHIFVFRIFSGAVSRAPMVLNYSCWVVLGSGTGVGN